MSAKESVWDYPRPPAVEQSGRRVRVVFAGKTIADSTAAYRVLETSHPPTFYIPRSDVETALLRPNPRITLCEFKGAARYFDVVAGARVAPAAAWYYPNPVARYAQIADHVAFYPALMDECWVDDDRVEAQGGAFYGGWITPDITGPFKGS